MLMSFGTNYEKLVLEKNPKWSYKNLSRSYKLISINAFYKEIRLDIIEQRRQNHKLTLFFKMTHNMVHLHLSSLVQLSVRNVSHYNLRNSNDLQTIEERTNIYYNTSLPSTIRAWNNLPEVAKSSDSAQSFKNFLNRDKEPTAKYYYIGNRKAQILHARLCTNCSSRNLDFFLQRTYPTLHHVYAAALKILSIFSFNVVTILINVETYWMLFTATKLLP